MGVSAVTYGTWEQGVRPGAKHWPAIIAFLGYDPSPQPETAGERIRSARRKAGLTAQALAKVIGCDRETVSKWERNLGEPGPTHVARLAMVLGPKWRADPQASGGEGVLPGRD